MEIFALRGRGNSGKTTTVREVHGLFLANGYRIVDTTFDPSGGDFRTVFKKKGKLVGITSSGDTFDLVRNNLRALINAGCTICVCACRTFDRGAHGTNAAIDTFLPRYRKHYIDKTIAPTPSRERTVNSSDAYIVFNTVDALV